MLMGVAKTFIAPRLIGGRYAIVFTRSALRGYIEYGHCDLALAFTALYSRRTTRMQFSLGGGNEFTELAYS